MIALPQSRSLRIWLGLSPAYAIIGIFMLIPMVIMAVFSFLEANPYGGVHFNFSTEAYFQIFLEYDLEDNLVLWGRKLDGRYESPRLFRTSISGSVGYSPSE